MNFFKKIIAGILLLVLFTGTVFAQGLNSTLGIQSYMTLDGVNIVPIDSTYELGSTSTRWAKGWFTDLDVSGVLTVGGAAGSDVDLDGYNLVLDQDGDTALVNDRDGSVADDEVAIQVAGSTDFTISANTLTVESGSDIKDGDGRTYGGFKCDIYKTAAYDVPADGLTTVETYGLAEGVEEGYGYRAIVEFFYLPDSGDGDTMGRIISGFHYPSAGSLTKGTNFNDYVAYSTDYTGNYIRPHSSGNNIIIQTFGQTGDVPGTAYGEICIQKYQINP